mmetsp:Transcript_8356/g.10210  ORF Transcript_8356/g.10210 Transcript_8356/m.10210 type:complete len:656 (-) Transcript_8356:43-2010(-)
MFCSCTRETRRTPPTPPPEPPPTEDNRRRWREQSKEKVGVVLEEGETKRLESTRIEEEDVGFENKTVQEQKEKPVLKKEISSILWLLLFCVFGVLAWLVEYSVLREFALLCAGFTLGAYKSQRSKPTDSKNLVTRLKNEQVFPNEKKSIVLTNQGQELAVSNEKGNKKDDDSRVYERLKKAILFLQASAKDPGSQGWIYWGSCRQVELWFQTDKVSGVKHSLGIADIDAPPEIVGSVLESEQCKRVYDGQWKKTTIIRDLDSELLENIEKSSDKENAIHVRNVVVRRDEYNGVFPAKARDAIVVYARYDYKKNADTALCLTSVCPQDNTRDAAHASDDSNYVRMQIDCGGYLCKALDSNRTRVISVVVLDPKGLVPTPVVNFVAMDRPMSLARLRALDPIKNYVTPQVPAKIQKQEEQKTEKDELVDLAATRLKEMLSLDADPISHNFTQNSTRDDPLAVFIRRQAGSDGIVRFSVISRSLIHASINILHDAIEPGAPKLDKNRAETKLLAEIGQAGDQLDQGTFNLLAPIRCFYFRYKPVMLTAPRDALVAIVDAAINDGIRARITFSIDHLRFASTLTTTTNLPLQNDAKLVRMIVHLNGFLFRTTSTPHRTLTTNFALFDPSGGLPNRLRERLAKARLKQLHILSSLVHQED